MSVIKVDVVGTAKYFPDGMFDDPVVVTDGPVIVEANMTGMMVTGDGSMSALLDTLKALANRDMAAPSFGSASSLPDREKFEGELRLTVEQGVALLRVYHQQASEFNLEVSGGKYIALNGEPTDEPWETIILAPGTPLTVPVIESNAITVAIYA